MQSILNLRPTKPKPDTSSLEGLPTFRTQQADSSQRRLGRREWWLWLSALFVTLLSAAAFLLSSVPSFFLHTERFYEIRADQARWAIMCLLLLFNGWLVYRQWSFRRMRRQLSGASAGLEAQPGQALSPTGSVVDPATGLYTRAFVEQQLGKEIARAKRQSTPLSLATVHVDEFGQLNQRYGPSTTDLALKELARRLKKACRGSDFAVRLANDDFLLVLPECGLGEVKVVLDRLNPLELSCDGRKISLTCTTGWVDYQPGDLPVDLLKRASALLHLYENAAKDTFASTLAPH